MGVGDPRTGHRHTRRRMAWDERQLPPVGLCHRRAADRRHDLPDLLRMNPIEVVIPSYGRPEQVWTRTVRLLLSRNVPAEWITVWVADEDQAHEYAEAMPIRACGGIKVA